MGEVLQQLQAFYGQLEPGRRRALWAAFVAALIVVGGVGWWASRTPYNVLMRAASQDEAAAVTRALSGAGIPFEIASDNRTVLVPAGREVDARRAASSGDGIVGLEGLEQIDPWVSPFQEQLHRQRMLQGELVRTINAIEGVSASTVQLNLPERAAFLRDEARSTAAVTVRPDEGATLDRAKARSIAQLVSHAVSGMTADDVTVVDASSGRLVWAGASADPENPANGDLNALAARREAALADGVRGALARILGKPDAAAVTVHVELETSAIQSTVSEIDPESAAPARERIESEENGDARVASGIPGTTANTPERAGGTASTGAAGRKRDTSETTFQYSQTQTTTVRPAGDVRRLSAAVMIDQAALAAVLGDKATAEDQERLKRELEQAVRASVGFSSKRGDEVVVSFLTFAPAVLSEEEAVPASTVVERFLPQALAIVAVVLAFLLVVRPLVAAVRPSGGRAAGGEALDPDAVPANSPILAGGDDENDVQARIRKHVERFQSLQPQHVSDLVRRESENSAEVLRRWIRTQQGGAM